LSEGYDRSSVGQWRKITGEDNPIAIYADGFVRFFVRGYWAFRFASARILQRSVVLSAGYPSQNRREEAEQKAKEPHDVV
jgi:hypothetical protein